MARPDVTAGEVVQTAVARSVSKVRRLDSGVRAGHDVEVLHEARVATRRLRSDLRTFRPLLDKEWAAGLRRELGWLAGLFGAVRDRDVLLYRMRGDIGRLPRVDQEPVVPLLGVLESERIEARATLLAAMDSDRYIALLDALQLAAKKPMLSAEADDAAKPALAALVRRSRKHVGEAVTVLGKRPEDEQLHEVRIRAKRTRYAAEAAAPVWGKPARKLASAMADVQKVLGDFQDAVVAEEWLRRSGRASVAQSFAAGELVAMQRTAMAASRDAFPSVWKRAGSAKLESWLH
jgi:CHAD domain-containing protein